MNIAVIAVLYGLLLYTILGGFLLTVCTDYPEHLREHRKLLMKAYRQNYMKTVLVVLFWYVIGLAIWPHIVVKYRS
ncbi:hypothetical protein D3C85_174700 [compost metagenome]